MKLSPRAWRIIRRSAYSLLGVLVVLVLTVAGLGVYAVRNAFPQQEGSLTLKGLTAPVRVLRDDYGIPQIYAKTEQDLFRAQGYVHAQDRFWEMDFRRHVTAGRLSELFGESQLTTDKYLRTMGWRHVSEKEWQLLDKDTKIALNSYAEGVNAWLEANPGGSSLEYSILGLQNSDYEIEKWTPIDSLAWLKAMAWDLRGNMDAEIDRQILLGKGISKERVDALWPAYPYDRNVPIVPGSQLFPAAPTQSASVHTGTGQALSTLKSDLASIPGLMGNSDRAGIGSNSWVLSGRLTASGKPILANDPHLSPSQPGIWYQLGLHCECGIEVAGFTFSGVPGVIIGHNARIAWGFTNLGPDVIDMYWEKLDGSTPITTRTETFKVAGGADVTITVRSTKHGPILSDASDELRKLAGDQGIALRWTALDPGKTADAITVLNKAKDWNDFRKAAALFEVPAQNLIYADVDGNIGYQSPGRIPMRGKGDGRYFAPGWDPEYDWTGYIPFEDLPSAYNPAQGYVVTANQAVAAADYDYMLTTDWAYGYRSQRINDMIKDRRGALTADDVQKMQFDNKNTFAPALVPLLLQAPRPPLSQVEREADALLRGWTSFTQPDDSAPAAYYNAIWRHLLLDTFDEFSDDPAVAPGGGDRWFEVMRPLLEKPDDPWWDAKSTPEVEKRDDILARAMSDAVKELADLQGETAKDWNWGELHTLTPTHATFGKSGIGPIEWMFNHSPVPTAGGKDLVNATGWNSSAGYEVDAVPSMRMIVDLSNLNESRWIQLTGNSGHAFHPNYDDQLELWRTGQLLTFRFDQATIEKENMHVLTLSPLP